MEVKLNHGILEINLYELLENLDKEELRKIADYLACHDSIIEDVCAQIVTGWTERESHGALMRGQIEPHTPLEKAIREIAVHSSEIAKDEIAALVATAKILKYYQDTYRDWAWRLYHGWNKTQVPEGCPIINLSSTPEYEIVRKERSKDNDIS